jgi:hypothetical protein
LDAHPETLVLIAGDLDDFRFCKPGRTAPVESKEETTGKRAWAISNCEVMLVSRAPFWMSDLAAIEQAEQYVFGGRKEKMKQ